MKHRMRDRTGWAIGLCAVMLGFCLLILMHYLRPQRLGFVTAGPHDAALGMVLIDIADEETADSYHVDTMGVYVLAVQENGQAQRAGVASGDRLVCVNEHSLGSTTQFLEMQKAFSARQEILLGFRRGSNEQPYEVMLVWNAD